MKALVTGGAGFIGYHICQQLLNAGHTVVALDNMIAGQLSNIRSLLSMEGGQFSFIQADILDADIERYLDGVDVVYSIAASKKNVCLKDPRQDLAINGGGILNLLLAAHKAGVKRFVHASTGSVYGKAGYPISYYGISKQAGEGYVRLFGESMGLETTVLRYFHVFGPRQVDLDDLGGVVAIFIRRLLQGKPLIVYGDGEQERCFTYVKDVADITINAPLGVYDVVSHNRITINRLIEILFAMTGKRVDVIYKEAQPGDIKYFNPQHAIGYNYTHFEAGLKETLNESRYLYR